MTLTKLKEIEKEIDEQLKIHDRAIRKKDNETIAKCVAELTLLMNVINGDTIRINTLSSKH